MISQLSISLVSMLLCMTKLNTARKECHHIVLEFTMV